MSSFFHERKPNLIEQVPRSVRTQFLISTTVSLSTLLLLLTAYFPLQPVIPLFYTLSEAREILVPKEWLAAFPALSIVMTVLHASLTRSLRKDDSLLVRLFSWNTVAWQLLLLVIMVRTVWIVW